MPIRVQDLSCLSSSECAFCDVSVERGFKVVAENDSLIAFRDRSPAAAFHLLVIPKTHIKSVRELTSEDISLVKSMKQFGEDALDTLNSPVSKRSFGFHIPPVTSVDHLHLHCFNLPFLSTLHAWKYPISRRKDGRKGLSWFAEVGQVLKTLEAGDRVKIWPERS